MVHNQHEKIKTNPEDIDGNPRAISKRKIESICNLIKCGNYVKPSVKANDVNYNTFLSYMRKGKNGVAPYEEYYRMVEQAKAQAETDMSMRIHESAMNGNVGADMWKMQRMFPQRWSNPQRQEIKVDNAQKIEILKYSEVNKENKEE